MFFIINIYYSPSKKMLGWCQLLDLLVIPPVSQAPFVHAKGIFTYVSHDQKTLHKTIIFHHFPMVFHHFPSFSHGFPSFSHGFPSFSIIFPWFSLIFHHFPMVFGHFSSNVATNVAFVSRRSPLVRRPGKRGLRDLWRSQAL